MLKQSAVYARYAAALLAACTVATGVTAQTIVGSGKVIEAARPLTGYTRIVITGPVDVVYTAGAADKVVVHGDDNLVPLVETRIEEGNLIVGLRGPVSLTTRNKLEVRVTGKQLDGVLLRGSGDVRADRVKAGIFEATLLGSGDVAIDAIDADTVALSSSGSGEFRAAGKAAKFGLVIGGSGEVRADQLQAEDVAVRISGSGDAHVHATGTLQVDIAGSGDVSYRGNPKVSQRVSGSGEVQKLR
jgi:hypothetical protein